MTVRGLAAPTAFMMVFALVASARDTVQRPAPPVLRSAQAVIASTAVLAQVSGLQMEAKRTIRSSLPSAASGITLNFVIPDGFLMTLSFSQPLVGQRYVPGNIYRGFVGDRLFVRADEPNNTRFGPNTKEQDAAALTQRRRLATELLAGLLLTRRTPLPIEFTLVGQAVSGAKTADVLEGTCPDGYRFQLFLESTTHRVVMMVPGPGGGMAPASKPDEPQRWFFSDHRKVKGDVWLPHTIVREVRGVTAEEWLVHAYTLNPPVPRDLRR